VAAPVGPAPVVSPLQSAYPLASVPTAGGTSPRMTGDGPGGIVGVHALPPVVAPVPRPHVLGPDFYEPLPEDLASVPEDGGNERPPDPPDNPAVRPPDPPGDIPGPPPDNPSGGAPTPDGPDHPGVFPPGDTPIGSTPGQGPVRPIPEPGLLLLFTSGIGAAALRKMWPR
jgi:hypothetical protein